MKQTIIILTALIAALLMTAGLTLNANLDLSHQVALLEEKQEQTEEQMKKKGLEQEKIIREKAETEENLQKTLAERDAFAKQLNAAETEAQKAKYEAEQVTQLYQRQQMEMEALAAEYEDLSVACDALEASIITLNEETVQAAMRYEAQSLEDAIRIDALEKELRKAQTATATPAPTVSPAPPQMVRREWTPLLTFTPTP